VFASDSRTNAGVDQVATYGKMHAFGRDGERQLVLLSAGNLATTQGVISQIERDIGKGVEPNLMSVSDISEATEYVGETLRALGEKHGAAVSAAGISAEATFIVGGQIGADAPRLYLVYPQGNYITTSSHTLFLQIGETKYGKAILDRVIQASTPLDEAARCALVSIDSTMRSNATVGPPLEIASYRRDSLKLEHYLYLEEDDAYLLEIRRAWNENLLKAFRELPRFRWDSFPRKRSCE